MVDIIDKDKFDDTGWVVLYTASNSHFAGKPVPNEEDEKNNHPNSIILSKGKVLYFFDFECPHERIGNFVFLKDIYDINHLSVNCFSALMENRHVKIQIRNLFDVLKDFVKS